MISSKYAGYYRMDTEKAPDGKVKTKMVYTGPLFRWKLTGEALKRQRLLCLVPAVAGWLILLGSMLFYSDLSRLFYIILPHACQILVLCFYTAAVYNFFTAAQPMRLEKKDKTYDRMRGSAMVGMVLGAGTFAGEVSAVIFLGFTKPADILFMAAAVFLFLLFLYGFKMSGGLTVVEEENPAKEEWKNR